MIAVNLVARITMKRTSKILVVAAFSARLPVIAISITRLVYLRDTFSSPNRTLTGSSYAVCTQMQLGYSIISLSMTGMGSFLRPCSNPLSTSYRRFSDPHDTSTSESSQRSGNRSKATEFRRESFGLARLKAKDIPTTNLNGGRRDHDGGYRGKAPRRSFSQKEAWSRNKLNLRLDMCAHKGSAAVSEGDCIIAEDIGQMERGGQAHD